MRDTLEIADRLAWKYLQPALKAKLVEKGTTVLTYFQKSPSIRLIPYAPVALIGIPPTALLRSDGVVARDLLSTAHEVGHYVYRHGTYNEKPIYRALAEQMKDNPIPPEYEHWLEELYADLYGGLSGGAVTALSSQDLALQYYSLPEFFKDDGEHPPPNWRPYIYVKVLKKMGQGEIADALCEEWNKHRNSRKDRIDTEKDSDKIKFEGDRIELSNRIKAKDSDKIKFEEGDRIELGNSAISFGSEIDVTKPVDRIISAVFDILEELNLVPSDEVSDVNNLYDNFAYDLLPLPELELGDPDESWEKWTKKENFFSNNEIPEMGVMGAGSKQPPEKDTWIPVAYCAGWTTKIGNHSGG
jgi:hypothetical protein